MENTEKKLCKCGRELDPGWKYCPDCRTPIEDDFIETNHFDNPELTQPTPEDYVVPLFYTLFALSFLGMFVCGIAAIIILVTGRLKYPENEKIKKVFNIVVKIITVITILLVQLLMACGKVLNDFRSCE